MEAKTLDPDTVFNLILISSSLFITYHLSFPLTILLLFLFFSTKIARQRATAKNVLEGVWQKMKIDR